MQNIPANLISIIAFAIVMLLAMLLLALKNRFTQMFSELVAKQSGQELLIIELQSHIAQLQEQLLENQSQLNEITLESSQVTKQLEHRIKILQEQQTSFINKLEQLSTQQPEDKLYSRALKLAELGADITEIMRECEIPRAEAEMLLAVHQQKQPR